MLLMLHPFQLQLMQKNGNSTQVVSSLIAVHHWITVSWLLVMTVAKIGLLKTLGVNHGEMQDISHLKLETPADVLMLPHIPKLERI